MENFFIEIHFNVAMLNTTIKSLLWTIINLKYFTLHLILCDIEQVSIVSSAITRENNKYNDTKDKWSLSIFLKSQNCKCYFKQFMISS